MLLSTDTLAILKNFAGINPSAIIKAGTTLTTMSVTKNIVATAHVGDKFPVNAAIYDLNQFLGAVALFKAPNFEWLDNLVRLSEGKTKVDYVYGDPSGILEPKKINESALRFIGEIPVSKADVEAISKAANTFGFSDLILQTTSDGDAVWKVTDKNDPNGNSYELAVENSSVASDSEFHFKLENLKMLPGDYLLKLASAPVPVAFFTSKTMDLQYFIALETTSKV